MQSSIHVHYFLFFPFPRGGNYEFAKIHWRMKRIFFSRTTGPISTKLGTMPLWVEGNEGPHLFQGEVITKLRRYTEEIKRIFFSRTTGPISTKLGTMPPWVKRIQVCSNEGPRPFPRGDNYEIAKNLLTKLKSSSPEPLGEFQPNLTQSILGSGDSSLFK